MVLDYAGGTYIGQESAVSASKAAFQWITSIPDEELIRWKITREELTAIPGSTRKGLALINVVATDQSLD